MAKQKNQKSAKYQPEKQWLQMLTVLVITIPLLVGGYALWQVNQKNARLEQAQKAREIDQRKQRIEEIFDSFGLDESYKVTTVDIFGDKRVYAWDGDRTYASSIEYMRFEPVDETVADVVEAIEQAGFESIDEPYPESVSHDYYFENSRGESVSLTVTSRDVNDAILRGQPPKKANSNAAPAVVLIKVNLDDSKE